MELAEMRGIGPAREETLRAMGINSLRDLLYTLPVRYDDYSSVSPCNSKSEGLITVSGVFTNKPRLSVFHGIKKVTATLEDASGKMPVCWYNMPWMVNTFEAGQAVRLNGKLSLRNNRRVLQNPKVLSPEETGINPVYRVMKGFPSKSFKKLIQTALEEVDDCCPETLPAGFRMKYQLCELNFAIRQAHFPASIDSLRKARRRLAFEQILLYLVYVSISGSRKQQGFSLQFPEEAPESFWKALPFAPTSAQKRVLNEIAYDLKKDVSMSRLVQGDVGCGKTAVGFGAAYLTAMSGYQACMMAPTEILASQHYHEALHILEPLGIRCRLLTGSTKAKERKEILKELKNQHCQIVFGTHALISKDVEYSKLGLVITDEQHRFGVNQRSALQLKGQELERVPHVLVMSATPIPRTMALILYGDLDLSVIDELPAGRIPVKTRIVPEQKREDMYGFLRSEISAGKQAYIVCPLVEDSEDMNELQSAKTLFENLRQKELCGLRIALTWGGQKAEEKETTLRAFSRGEYDVLVSTTVIEVGVNNPNATIMIIENADRFGLSQLHQLRGRVGRGKDESWCFLFCEHPERLRILCTTNDGFEISRKDLEQRGPGDLTGTRQAGDPANDFIFTDTRLLDEVTRCVQEMRRDSGQKEYLDKIGYYAEQYFAESGRRIALN